MMEYDMDRLPKLLPELVMLLCSSKFIIYYKNVVN
jgi:hypothetical protein